MKIHEWAENEKCYVAKDGEETSLFSYGEAKMLINEHTYLKKKVELYQNALVWISIGNTHSAENFAKRVLEEVDEL